MNMTVLGGICKRDRQTAKHISALLLGRTQAIRRQKQWLGEKAVAEKATLPLGPDFCDSLAAWHPASAWACPAVAWGHRLGRPRGRREGMGKAKRGEAVAAG